MKIVFNQIFTFLQNNLNQSKTNILLLLSFKSCFHFYAQMNSFRTKFLDIKVWVIRLKLTQADKTFRFYTDKIKLTIFFEPTQT